MNARLPRMTALLTKRRVVDFCRIGSCACR